MVLRSTQLRRISEKKRDILFLILLLAAYVLGVTIGFICGVGDLSYTTSIQQSASNHTQLYSMEPFNRFLYIARNNLMVSLKCCVYGTFSMGLFSLFLLVFNGFVLGDMIGRNSHFLSTEEICKSTLPHSLEFVGIALFGLTGKIMSTDIFTRHPLRRLVTCVKIASIATFIIIFTAAIEGYVSMSS